MLDRKTSDFLAGNVGKETERVRGRVANVGQSRDANGGEKMTGLTRLSERLEHDFSLVTLRSSRGGANVPVQAEKASRSEKSAVGVRQL
jgi:hypothetical protein